MTIFVSSANIKLRYPYRWCFQAILNTVNNISLLAHVCTSDLDVSELTYYQEKMF